MPSDHPRPIPQPPTGRGDPGLVARYREPLIRYFSRRGVPVHAADDLAHDCFTRLFALAGRDHIDNEEAYIFRIASSVYTDHVRRAHSRQAANHVGLDATDMDQLAAEEPGADRVLEGQEAFARLLEALKELKPKTREIFLLNRIDGLTYTAIAVRYGVTSSAIEKHMMRALVHLNSRLAEWRE